MVSPRESTEGDWWRDIVVVSPRESRGGLVEGRSPRESTEGAWQRDVVPVCSLEEETLIQLEFRT